MKKYILLLVAVICYNISDTYAQNISQSQLSSIKVDELSDAKIKQYWERAQSEGYSLSQLEIMAKAKGMPSSEISKLKLRVLEIQKSKDSVSSVRINEPELDLIGEFGLGDKDDVEIVESPIFGMDFFNNPNISFVPNLNVATPDSYEIGPGDKLLIDVWGASEGSYLLNVEKEGAVRIERLGPIYVSGLTVREASEKIINYLKKIYLGIGASVNDPVKTYASVSLSKARNVQINIIGEIKVPGTYNISAMSTVINALYAAGGPTKEGSFRDVKLIREGKELRSFDLYSYFKFGFLNENELLRDQDVIVVPSYLNQVSVYGEVRREGVYEMKKDETFKDLLLYSNGFTAEANQRHISVSRYTGRERSIIDIDYLKDENVHLENGDQIVVSRSVDRFVNKISIEGAVYSPGDFEFVDGLDLNTLLQKANGVRDFAFLKRGIIHRKINDTDQEIISFNLNEIISGDEILLLKAGDLVEIFDQTKIRETYTVNIDGAVNNPDSYDFESNMTVKDLILLAGGYKEGANQEFVDIYRLRNDGNPSLMSVNIKDDLSRDLTILKPFDRISVRYVQGFSKLKNVSIQGEVAHPGKYSIETRTERVSDLIEKSGGLLESSYYDGITIVRNIDEFTKKTQLEELKKVVEKDSLVDQSVIQNTFRIGVNYQKIVDHGKGSVYDLILEEGDVLIVPASKSTVQIQGAVMNASLKPFEKGESLKNYINGSGGFHATAKKSKVYVIYANGSVQGTKSFLFFKSYPEIKPGCIIVVPEKPERKGLSAAEIIGITSALTSMGILIQSAISN